MHKYTGLFSVGSEQAAFSVLFYREITLFQKMALLSRFFFKTLVNSEK